MKIDIPIIPGAFTLDQAVDTMRIHNVPSVVYESAGVLKLADVTEIRTKLVGSDEYVMTDLQTGDIVDVGKVVSIGRVAFATLDKSHFSALIAPTLCVCNGQARHYHESADRGKTCGRAGCTGTVECP